MPRYLSTEALVINKKTLKETDLLITLLTPKDGKIIALAKEAKECGWEDIYEQAHGHAKANAQQHNFCDGFQYFVFTLLSH